MQVGRWWLWCPGRGQRLPLRLSVELSEQYDCDCDYASNGLGGPLSGACGLPARHPCEQIKLGGAYPPAPFAQARACPSTATLSDCRFPDFQRACAKEGAGSTEEPRVQSQEHIRKEFFGLKKRCILQKQMHTRAYPELKNCNVVPPRGGGVDILRQAQSIPLTEMQHSNDLCRGKSTMLSITSIPKLKLLPAAFVCALKTNFLIRTSDKKCKKNPSGN